jgi:serine O-acetyltransferase
MRAKLPGLDASTLWGCSAWLHQRRWFRLARVVKALNYVIFRTILPPEAKMAAVPALMHHGLGVVIHPTTEFGSGVTLGHQVTIAASPADARGHVDPVILEDRVFVGAGAILLARSGPLRIGRGAVIGAGSVVVDDVPAGGRVFGNPARPPRTL